MNSGELLKSSRKKLGWTQQDLADYFEISQRVVISYWEQGERPIPDGALKMAKRVQRMSKKDARACYILSGGKSPKKPHAAYIVPKCDSLHSLEEKSTPTPPVTDFLEKYQEDSMERYILEAYITFKRSAGRFPTAEDFVNGKFKVKGAFKEIKKEEALEYFGSLRKAKKLAGELMRCQRRGYRKKEQAHTLEAIRSRKNNQTAITYIDPDDKYNWLKALYPGRDFDTYKSEVKARTFTWKKLFKYRPESEALVAQIVADEG